ncbi:MAG: hypothetical protein HKN82_08205 [Akkermansiaceae bacterium]|nr:hypothetical protein [Akkermansiaceae bacterium]NNM31262.1 hypothetical protein [Akkermansiaceae bacterium]
MCTLTWLRNGGGTGTYEVFFNRDEKKTRSVAKPPKPFTVDGVSFLAPIDPDSRGTWMFANEHGLVVCLLNRWEQDLRAPREPVLSRGKLVWGLSAMRYVPEVGEGLQRAGLENVRPFTLVAFDRVGEAGWDWDGEVLADAKLELPVSSSSFHSEQVLAARRARLQDYRRGGAVRRSLLEEFHGDTHGGPSASTVRMNRPDAQTVSRSVVNVGTAAVAWTYLAEPAGLEGSPAVTECSLPAQ